MLSFALIPMWRPILFGCLAIAASAFAQEGHPLSGTWTGDWGVDPGSRTHITLVMNWDGEHVTGVLNPGPDSTSLERIVVNYTNWTVRIDADAKDASGKPVRIEAQGKLEDLGSPRRRLVGTWRQGELTGEFQVSREP